MAGNPMLASVVLANGISAIGNWLYLTIIPVLIYRETEDPALVGIAAAARLLPWMLLSIPAGIVADRVSRRHLLLAVETIRASLMFVMAGLLFAGAPLWTACAIALAAVVAGTFATPAHGTLIPDLARDDEELGTANVVSSAFDNVACVIGPAFAGILIAIGGVEVAVLMNGLSFLVVVAVLVALVRHSSQRDHARTAIEQRGTLDDGPTDATWRRIARAAMRPLAMDAAISFAAGATFILPVLLAVEMPGGSEAIVGVFGASAGLGGLVGAAAAAAFVNRRLRQGLLLGTVTAVLSLALLAWTTTPLIIAGSIGLAAAALTQLDTLNMTALQRATESARLGRTLGLLHSLAAAWIMAGSLVAGILASAGGIGFAVIACAGCVAILGGLALSPARQSIVRHERSVLTQAQPGAA